MIKLGKGFLGKRFLLTAGTLLAVFGLLVLGYNVRDLEILVPAILAFYHGADAWENVKKSRDNDNGGH